MHFIVIVRYVFFAIAIPSLIGLFVMSILGMHNSVTLSSSTLVWSLLMSIYFTLLLITDFIRTKSGFAYRCFIFKIWWELVSLTIFTIVTLVLLVADIVKPQGAACFQHKATSEPGSEIIVQPSQHVCTISNSIWTFEIIIATASFCYVFFLGVITVEQFERTHSVIKSGVRDFNWKANITPTPYHVDYDPYTGSSYTADRSQFNRYKARLAISRASRESMTQSRAPHYIGSLNASRSTFTAPSSSSVAFTAPSESSSAAFTAPSSNVSFANLRKMEEAHVRPIPGGTRFIEQLDDD